MTYTVSEFNAIVSNYLSDGLGTVTVRGEVVDFKIAQDRLVFFDLKDSSARVNCFMMKWELHQQLEEGMEIEVTGRAALFKQSGRFHIRAIDIQLVGSGAIARAFKLLKEKLEKEGLFALERKRPLPVMVETIGIVTSPQAAAYTDILRVLKNRWPVAKVVLAPSLVQGVGAVKEIVSAIESLNYYPGIEVIIVTRGGGAAEDLQAFNSELVARAISSSRVPIVSAVGHERDITIADLVADLRAATPSNAAEIIVPDQREIINNILLMRKNIYDAGYNQVLEYGQVVTSFIKAGYIWLSNYERRLIEMNKLLTAFNPQETLKRGYTITRNAQHQIIRSIKGIKIGEQISTQLYNGQINSEVVK